MNKKGKIGFNWSRIILVAGVILFAWGIHDGNKVTIVLGLIELFLSILEEKPEGEKQNGKAKQ